VSASPKRAEQTRREGRLVPVHQALAEDIKALGIEAVFGLMSDDTAVFATSLDSSGVRFYGARHENAGIAMAEGYAAASGRLAVALIGRGPATANGLHAATYAARTGSPLLIMYGDAVAASGINSLGPDYKGFNAQGVLAAAGLRTFTATSPQTARQVFADAVAAAQRGAAVTLHLPTNVQLAEIEVREGDRPAIPDYAPRRAQPRPQAIEAAASLLRASRRPVIVAGRGAHLAGAREALEGLAERIGALLVTSAKGKDLFRGSPWNLGIVGSFSHSAARRHIDQADCVLAVGAGLNFFTSSFGHSFPAAPLIQVDVARAAIGRWHPADVAVVGDARLAAEQLRDALPERPAADKPFRADAVRKALAAFDLASDFEAAHTPRTVDPRSLAIELDKLLPANRRLVYDAGNFLIALPYLSLATPGHLKMTSEFASIGLGFGAALGVAKAHPGEPTVLVIGDGGFLMTMGELETVVREDLPMVIVLMNDCAYGAELHFLKARQLPVSKSVFPDVDFAPIAEAFGFQAATIRTLDDLRRLAPTLRDPQGPILLDCKINAAVAAPFISEFAAFEARH